MLESNPYPPNPLIVSGPVHLVIVVCIETAVVLFYFVLFSMQPWVVPLPPGKTVAIYCMASDKMSKDGKILVGLLIIETLFA